jgi:hypothetical protein
VAANYRAATRSESDAELYSKTCIVLEEMDETYFWLEKTLALLILLSIILLNNVKYNVELD